MVRHFFFDENLGRNRPSKAAFEDDEDGHPMSVVLADLVTASGRGSADVLKGHEGFALAQITAGLARSKQQGVQRDPLPDEPAHALVFGNKTDSVRKAFVGGIWCFYEECGLLKFKPRAAPARYYSSRI